LYRDYRAFYEPDGFYRSLAERPKQMDDKTLDLGVFIKSLTEEQADACESDEKQLGEIFSAGWTEKAAVLFHRAMLHARRVDPQVTVEGVFEMAFQLGLTFIGDEEILARINQGQEDDVVVYGLQRKDGKDTARTSGSVLMDGATVVKIKPKRVRGWKKGQVRGL
jgi:hypothetical protein